MSNLGLSARWFVMVSGWSEQRSEIVCFGAGGLGLERRWEQSGHMILSDYATTGDGLIAALQVLGEMAETGRKASEVLRQFDPVPQLLKNVRYQGGTPLKPKVSLRRSHAKKRDWATTARSDPPSGPSR